MEEEDGREFKVVWEDEGGGGRDEEEMVTVVVIMYCVGGET